MLKPLGLLFAPLLCDLQFIVWPSSAWINRIISSCGHWSNLNTYWSRLESKSGSSFPMPSLKAGGKGAILSEYINIYVRCWHLHFVCRLANVLVVLLWWCRCAARQGWVWHRFGGNSLLLVVAFHAVGSASLL
jgi:hypothetical protein